MAKRKNLLLTEAVTSRMMGLAGIGSLVNPFLREQLEEGTCKCGKPTEEGKKLCKECGMYEGEEMDEGWHGEEEMEEGRGGRHREKPDFGTYEDESLPNVASDDDDEDLSDTEGDVEDPRSLENFDDDYFDDWTEEDKENMEHEEDEEGTEDEEDEEQELQENIRRSVRKLKRLLEQAEAAEAPKGEEPAPEMPPAEGGGDEMESKIKDFVKKLGELVQETLGVEVTVEEGEGEKEPEGGEDLPPPPAGGAGAPPAGGAPAPMAEAINRLVNKVARRVKARLMESKSGKKPLTMAKKEGSKEKEKRREAGMKVGLSEKKKLAADKKKKMEMIAKKKEADKKKAAAKKR